jgi:hypothetical protein
MRAIPGIRAITVVSLLAASTMALSERRIVLHPEADCCWYNRNLPWEALGRTADGRDDIFLDMNSLRATGHILPRGGGLVPDDANLQIWIKLVPLAPDAPITFHRVEINCSARTAEIFATRVEDRQGRDVAQGHQRTEPINVDPRSVGGLIVRRIC